MPSPSRAVANACIKGIVCPLGISPLSQSQSTLIPKPKFAFSQLARAQCCLRCLHTSGGEYHKCYLCGHLQKVGYFNNSPLPILIPLVKIPKGNPDCRLPHKDVIGLGEAWPCDSPVLSPLVVFTHKEVWTVSELLGGFYDLSYLWECRTALKDGLNEHIERGYPPLRYINPTLVAVASASSVWEVQTGNSDLI